MASLSSKVRAKKMKDEPIWIECNQCGEPFLGWESQEGGECFDCFAGREASRLDKVKSENVVSAPVEQLHKGE